MNKLVAVLAISCGLAVSAPTLDAQEVMNHGGVPYTISNTPSSTNNWVGTEGKYSTNFNTNVKGPVEHFDVYGKVQTKYSQVYWTRNAPIELPPELVKRFDGKVMAITGYEIDQVTHSAPEKESGTGTNLGGFSCFPECSETDKSVPIYNAYNHHYFGWLTGKDSEVYDLKTPTFKPNPTHTGIRDLPHNHSFPTNIVFKENPGGEFRKSYHGYPSGYAQLLHSPTQWLVEPMQIDTHNRNYGINDATGYKPWFLPQRDNNSMTDHHSSLSPLVECPCSDRITRSEVNISTILTSGTCGAAITSEADCTAAVAEVAKVTSTATVSNASMPSGCVMIPQKVGAYKAIYNTAKSSQKCGEGGNTSFSLQGHSNLGGLVDLTMSHDGHSARISMTGPAGVWFGVGFNAAAMKDLPYAIIVDGSGHVTEHKLVDHGPGSVLASSVVMEQSSVTNGIRTIVVTRPVVGASKEHYSIPTTPGEINVITAVGNDPTLGYHKARTGAKIVLLPTTSSACLCQPQTKKYMTYMNESTAEFEGYKCFDEPRSDMLMHGDGTGRKVQNFACAMETYHGGLVCCAHTFLLTDLGQDKMVPQDKVDTYYLKWRYYFQEYVPSTATIPASHGHLHHWVFLIDQQVNDYEEDNAHYGTRSLGKITAHLRVRDMGLEDTPKTYKTVTSYVITPHCHAPSCLRTELWNADTGELICNATTSYGTSQYGALSDVFNEANYLTINPCIFGHQKGLQKPIVLTPDTNLTAIKYFNNTFRHLGQMAQWTGLMKYDSDLF